MGTIWYLWAINNDPVTNGYLVKVIGEQNPECEYKDKLCADGKRRDLFQCPMGYENVQKALTAISEFGLKVEVFKEGKNGVVRYDLWKPHSRKKARQMAHRRIITLRKMQLRYGRRY